MPTTNSRKHTIPAGTEASFNRETIFASFGNSIRDVVPVANTTDRAQVVADLTADGEGPSTTKPLLVHRADAPGLHRLEVTTDGTLWLPASGVLTFSDVTARDTWTTANSGLLTAGDVCRVGADRYEWQGSAWNSWATQSLGSGWDTASSASSGVRYRRTGSLLEILPSDYVRTSNLTVNAAANVTIATLPSGFRPSSTRALGGGSIGVAGNLGASRWFLSSAGLLYFQSMVTSGTMASGGGAVNHVDHGHILVDLT